MENLNANLKNLSRNKIYLILIGLAAIILATVLIYSYVEFSGTKITKISVVQTGEGKPYCGAIGSRSEGWYIDSDFNRPKLIKRDNCEGCFAVCKAIGSRSEGWYSSCDGKLIKYDNCGEVSVCGDVNCDGEINVIDVVKVEKCSQNSDDCDFCSNWAADVNCDGKIDENDSVEIYKRALDPDYALKCCSDTDVEDCAEEGEKHLVHQNCCSGLNSIKIYSDDSCSSYIKSVWYCTKCGDGICKSPENKCNCSEDCKEETQKCTDTDHGKDYYTIGTVIKGSDKGFDSCVDDQGNRVGNSERVKEYYCENDNIMSVFFTCPFGCNQGQCETEVTSKECGHEGHLPVSGRCCEGLIMKGAATVGDNEECLYMRHLECLKCGDGACDAKFENKCNCPEDCKEEIER